MSRRFVPRSGDTAKPFFERAPRRGGREQISMEEVAGYVRRRFNMIIEAAVNETDRQCKMHTPIGKTKRLINSWYMGENTLDGPKYPSMVHEARNRRGPGNPKSKWGHRLRVPALPKHHRVNYKRARIGNVYYVFNNRPYAEAVFVATNLPESWRKAGRIERQGKIGYVPFVVAKEITAYINRIAPLVKRVWHPEADVRGRVFVSTPGASSIRWVKERKPKSEWGRRTRGPNDPGYNPNVVVIEDDFYTYTTDVDEYALGRRVWDRTNRRFDFKQHVYGINDKPYSDRFARYLDAGTGRIRGHDPLDIPLRSDIFDVVSTDQWTPRFSFQQRSWHTYMYGSNRWGLGIDWYRQQYEPSDHTSRRYRKRRLRPGAGLSPQRPRTYELRPDGVRIEIRQDFYDPDTVSPLGFNEVDGGFADDPRPSHRPPRGEFVRRAKPGDRGVVRAGEEEGDIPLLGDLDIDIDIDNRRTRIQYINIEDLDI